MTRKIARLHYIPLALLLLAAAAGSATNAIAQSSSLPGQRANAPVGRSGGRGQRSRPTVAARSPVVIRARAGETLAALSARFNVPVEDLAHANNLSSEVRLAAGQQVIVPMGSAPEKTTVAPPATVVQELDANRLRLTDGTAVEFDDAWEDSRGVWYRKGGLVNLVTRDRVAAIERKTAEVADARTAPAAQPGARVVEVAPTAKREREPVWIYLVGGARVEAEEVSETNAGAWYRRGGLSIFLERSRIERIGYERPTDSEERTATGAWIERGWTTGNPRLDEMIRAGGQRWGVDPYLIFCVMEQESRFNPRALSPKGAQGLMQLMPGTAARFGVRNSFDPQQNIMGGTRYLKLLLEQFGGRVDLVLASYNAGEGAVMKYGGNVPPYRETRDYVRRIGARYGQQNSTVQATAMTRTAQGRQK